MQTINLTSRFCFKHFFGAVKNKFSVLNVRYLVAPYALKKYSSGIQYVLTVASSILLFCSCQKEQLSDDAIVNSTTLSSPSASAKQSSTGFTISPNKSLNYGALICPPSPTGWLDFQTNVAGQLGVSCLRGSTSVPGTGRPNGLLSTNYNILLNFNSTIGATDGSYGPAPFVTNLTQYKIDLTNALLQSDVKPTIAVIENEESNRFFYSGSAWDYIKLLNAAIGVMHANGVKVANGGITNQGLNYLVYLDFLNQGKNDSAEQFRQLANVTPNSPITQDRGAFVDSLLQAYVQLDVDYVNFHWKGTSPNTESLKEVISYLQKRCNKPVITNELGQYDNDPNTLLAHIQLCTNMNLPYIVWYSPDQNDSRRATPLQYDDGSLTSTGLAYQEYLVN